VGCFFTLLMLSFEAQVLNFDEVKFIHSSICCLCFCPKKPLPIQGNEDLPYIFF
jgi:hypothetical protein